MKKKVGQRKKIRKTDGSRFDAIDAKLDRILGTVVMKKEFNTRLDQMGTREEFDAKFDAIANAMVTQKELHEFKEEVGTRLDKLERTVERLVTITSNMQKSIQDLLLEYSVVIQQMNRYDRWFKEIAEKVGIELKP